MKSVGAEKAHHRAEVLCSDGVVVVVRRSGGQNLGSLVGRRVLTPPLSRGAAESPKDRSTYATAYCRFTENFAKVEKC